MTINNLDLFYLDNEKPGTPILMIHGNSMNSSLFYRQFNSTILGGHRIIAVDLPGHGNSARSADPQNSYGVASYINTLIDFIHRMDIRELIIFGHSLGGHIAIHLADEIENVDIKGLAIMGTPPLTIPPDLARAFLPNPAMGYVFKPDLTAEETDMVTQSFIGENHEDYDLVRKSIVSCDPMVRPFIGQSIATDLKTDEVEIIQNAKFPVAVLHGEHEANVNAGYIADLKLPLWKDEIIRIRNASHSAFLENPDGFDAVIGEFMGDLTSAIHS